VCRSCPFDTLIIFTTTFSVNNMYSINIVVMVPIIWLYIMVVVVVISFSIIVSCIFISLLFVNVGCMLQAEASFSLQHGQHSNPAAQNLQHTTNREQNDRCGNSTAQSQAPVDGYINVRNMLST